jgi:hydroxymethylbilane synthase
VPRLRIATRRSALALAQARSVAEALGGADLVEVVTSGDRDAGAGDKSRWVAELERAVIEDEADLAVHSAKDVPAQLAPGLAIVAVPARADARDALCGAASVQALPSGARVGTSSLRRESQLRALREDVEVIALRGNVDTRLRRLEAGELDALVLALAGLHRLGRAGAAGGALDPEHFVPAAGQGALAVEARPDHAPAAEAAARLDDPEAATCLRAERALTAGLEASCRTPVGAHAVLAGGRLALTAFVGAPDGSAWARDRLEGPAAQPEELGARVAERLLAAGGADLLAAAEQA